MAAAIQSRGRRGSARMRPLSEINVTPLVDVMLVLLIVFMVAAPLLTVGVAVDLPKTAAQPIPDQGEPLTVTVASDGSIFVQETQVSIEDLVPRLQALSKAGYDQRIYIRGDQGRAYGEIARVMGRINSAGFRQIGLVMDPEFKATPVQAVTPKPDGK